MVLLIISSVFHNILKNSCMWVVTKIPTKLAEKSRLLGI